MSTAWDERDRQHALVELRVARMEAQLFMAHVDRIGLWLRDGMITPWGARSWLADLDGSAGGAPNE